jgi:hypothetical protein
MLGHGSPVLRSVQQRAECTPNNLTLSGRSPWLVIVAFLFALSSFNSCFAQDALPIESVPPAMRLLDGQSNIGTQVSIRMSWGGGQEVQWQGSIRYTGGGISRIRALGLTEDTPGSVYAQDGDINVTQQSPAAYGGVEFTVDYQPNAEIQTVFRDVDFPERLIRKSIRLEELLEAPSSHELDANQNRLTIARSPGDWLKLGFAKEHLVFQTGETFSVQVQPTMTGIRNQVGRCKASLVPARTNGPSEWSGELEFALDSQGSAEAKTLEFPIPAVEGVYDLRLQFEHKSFSQRISQAPLSRSLQFVALSPAPPKSSGELWREREVIDSTVNRIGRGLQWTQLLRASGFRSGATFSKRSVIEEDSQRLVQLEPGGWQAIGIKLDQIDEPVLLEIEYLAEEEAALGFSVLQPKSNGQIPAYGFDSGVVVSRTFAVDENSNSKLLRHQVVFWPSTTQPMLLVSNRSSARAAKFGKVRVLTGPSRLAADRHLPDGGLKDRTRQLMAFYKSPMFPENFGASEVYEPAIDQMLDDWLTFYRGADRLIQYLKAHGYTGAVLTAAADSGAIFPSEHLGATPIFDSGVFFASGQDPIQKDVLEMLFRMFDREGLTLVPAFAFSGPLPQLEARIREVGPQNFRPTDFRGQVSRLNGRRAAYSPLNPEVQDQVAKIIEEVTQRYTQHPSFKGISLLCRPDTFTQLNGRRWGYSSPTIAQFLDDSGGIQLASGTLNDASAVQNLLLGSKQQRWFEWRADIMAKWYKRLHATVDQGDHQRRLYLSAMEIYRHPDIVSSLSPSLHWSNKLEQAMLELGWDPKKFRDNPSVVLLKPRRIDENNTVAAGKIESQMEHSQKAIDFFKQQTITGELFSHQTRWAKFVELQSPSSFGNSRDEVLRLQLVTPSDWQNRKRFVESVRHLDSRLMLDGGWLLPMGQERSLIDLVDVFTRLPDLPFDTVESSNSKVNSGPVVVRQAITDGRWYFYCLNDSPWETRVTLTLNRGVIEKLESLSANPIEMQDVDGKRVVQLTLPPYSLFGGFSSAAATQAIDFEYTVADEVATRLKTRLNQLQLRLIQATDVQPLEVIENSSFENTSESPSGWEFNPNRASDFTIVRGENGNALQMKSETGASWIRSQTFDVPKTGRLSISVWMRTPAAQQPPLRIAVESNRNGYYRFGSTGSLAVDDASNQIGTTWRQYVVHFDDLPLEADAKLRVGFDLMNSGEVWIDRVELYDRLFDANDIQALTQRLAAARALVDSKLDYDLCRRMLNGYWLRFLNESIGSVDSVDELPQGTGELIVDQQPVVRTGSLFQRFRKMMAPRLQRR